MGLFNWIFGQFIDVISWVDDSNDTMVYRFNRQGNEIKYGAKLTVRESQIAVFVNEGQVADVLTPGIYELETKNIPILTNLQHWDHGFSSPFKAEVYFMSTKRFTNLKWGTKNPIMLRDPEFSMIRLRAFGTYEIRIKDARKFLTQIVGTDGHFNTSEIDDQLSNLIVSKFATVMGEDKTPVLDLAANYTILGEYVTKHISPYFDEYGLELTKMLVENISLPDEVEKAIDLRSSREITGNLDAHVQYQSGQALANGEGAVSDMVGLGAGLAMGQKMTNSMQAQATPPPIPNQIAQYFVAIDKQAQGPFSLEIIKEKLEDGSITKETQLWTQGLQKWEKAEILFSDSFRQTPPALP